MRRMRSAASLIAAIALSAGAVTGCSGTIGTVAESIVRGSDLKQPHGPLPIVEVDPPDASLAGHPVVAEAAHSVVKVHTVANACLKISEGSGFVIAPNRVMTSAHVVAGGDSVTVSVEGQDHAAIVVSYDPKTDISILDVPGLQAAPLAFDAGVAPTSSDAVVMGYPGGGPFTATPARIREVIELNGPDIYHTTSSVTREVYVIRGRVQQGDSGGPLIDLNGRVLGIAYGAAVDDPETGFVLTAKQVSAQATVDSVQPVATGDCMR
jgi:S1-C subfamily serine protease